MDQSFQPAAVNLLSSIQQLIWTLPGTACVVTAVLLLLTVYYNYRVVEYDDDGEKPAKHFASQFQSTRAEISLVGETGLLQRIDTHSNREEQLQQISEDTKLTIPEKCVQKSKKYSCVYCGRSFNQKGNRNAHLVKHTGFRKFECIICNRKFAKKQNLETHTRIHTGEKPFVCSFCDAGFNRKANLQRHLRTHTGEKPFKCDTCKKCFGSRSNLLSHQKSHKWGTDLKCKYCDREFKRGSYLLKHVERHIKIGDKKIKRNESGGKTHGVVDDSKHAQDAMEQGVIKGTVSFPERGRVAKSETDPVDMDVYNKPDFEAKIFVQEITGENVSPAENCDMDDLDIEWDDPQKSGRSLFEKLREVDSSVDQDDYYTDNGGWNMSALEEDFRIGCEFDEQILEKLEPSQSIAEINSYSSLMNDLRNINDGYSSGEDVYNLLEVTEPTKSPAFESTNFTPMFLPTKSDLDVLWSHPMDSFNMNGAANMSALGGFNPNAMNTVDTMNTLAAMNALASFNVNALAAWNTMNTVANFKNTEGGINSLAAMNALANFNMNDAVNSHAGLNVNGDMNPRGGFNANSTVDQQFSVDTDDAVNILPYQVSIQGHRGSDNTGSTGFADLKLGQHKARPGTVEASEIASLRFDALGDHI